jgi:hypothetical protein
MDAPFTEGIRRITTKEVGDTRKKEVGDTRKNIAILPSVR